MSILNRTIAALDRLSKPEVARAHCDIPCGIYDPHNAQLAALTCVRMIQLIEGLAKPEVGDKAANDLYTAQISRYVATKEQHAAICEHELVVIWTDYFRPEHLEKYPDLHDTFFKTAKLTSAVKQSNSMENAQNLLAGAQQLAEIFWDSKGVATRRGPSNQTVGGELVYVAG